MKLRRSDTGTGILYVCTVHLEFFDPVPLVYIASVVCSSGVAVVQFPASMVTLVLEAQDDSGRGRRRWTVTPTARMRRVVSAVRPLLRRS